MKYLILLILIFLFTGCKTKKEVAPEPELLVSLDITLAGNKILVANTLKNALKYDLDYGDGSKIIGDSLLNKPNLGLNNGNYHDYKKDGTYTVTLTAYDRKGQRKTQSKEVTIDFYLKNMPITDFSLEFSEDGIVKMTNLSKNYITINGGIFGGNVGYNTKVLHPTFELDLNGKYFIGMQTTNFYSSEKTDTITFTNIKEREKGYFKGNWFGKEIEIHETFDNQMITYWMDIAGGNSLLLLNNSFLLINNQILTLFNYNVKTDSVKTNQMKYEQILSKFKVGVQNSEDWSVNISGLAVSKSIEILEVKEVKQKKIIPEMDDRAFWITYRIKANFGEPRGSVDGILKMRYLIFTY